MALFGLYENQKYLGTFESREYAEEAVTPHGYRFHDLYEQVGILQDPGSVRVDVYVQRGTKGQLNHNTVYIHTAK